MVSPANPVQVPSRSVGSAFFASRPPEDSFQSLERTPGFFGLPCEAMMKTRIPHGTGSLVSACPHALPLWRLYLVGSPTTLLEEPRFPIEQLAGFDVFLVRSASLPRPGTPSCAFLWMNENRQGQYWTCRIDQSIGCLMKSN